MEEYEYISTLGEGAYGHVWKCQERSTGRIVAIKGFKQAHEEPEIMRLAVREVRVLQTLHHPAVIQLIEAFKSKSGRVYMVFPYVGRSAYQELDRHPDGVPPHTLKLLVWQLLQALAYLHRKKVIHRDIKPANILLSEGGNVKLCDFGFARYVRCGPHEVQRLSSYVVTRWYRAPEVLVGDLYGPAADIWSLGCTVAELATGVPLFPGKSTVDQLWRIMRCFGPLPPRLAARVAEDSRLTGVKVPPPGRTLRERLPGCEPGLLRLVEACLAMDPNVRPTAEDLLQLPYFWVVPRLLTGTPLERVCDRMLQEPGGVGVCNGGVTKGPTEGGTTAAQREMLPMHSGGNAAQRDGNRSVLPPPLVMPPSGRTASSTAPPPLGSNTSGGGGTSYNAVPPSMPPTPDMWAPEQRPGQQSTAAPSTAVSSTTPAAAASTDGTGSSNSSLLPMSPADIGSPEHLGCASNTCSSEADRDALDDDDDYDEGHGDRSVNDSRSSCTTRASSDTECETQPVRHVQLVADSPAHRHPPLRRVKQAQHPPPPSYSEQSVYPPTQQQQQQLLMLQQQQLHQQLHQQLQQQLQQQHLQQQQESRQQPVHPPQRPQRPSHRHIAHRKQTAVTSGGVVVSAVQPPPPIPPSQGLAPGPVAHAGSGSVKGHGTVCTTITNTSVGATTAISAGAASGVENQPPVTTAAAAAGGGRLSCTANSAGTQPYGTGMGAGGAGMEATGAGLGAETVFQGQTEAGASGGGGGGGAGGDVPGLAIGLGSGAIRSGGRNFGGTTLLSTAVSAVSLAQLLDMSGPLEPSARLANMDGGNGDGVKVPSSTIVTTDGMPYTMATGPSATPSIIMAGSATVTAASGVRDLCGGGGGGDTGAGGGRDDNELSLWPQSTGLLLLPHPSPPPAQSLQHQQGLVRVLSPERPLPPPPQLALATPSNNIDTYTTPTVSLSTTSDSLPSSRRASSRRTVQQMQAAPPPLPPAPATLTTTSDVHLTGGAADTALPMDNTEAPVRFLGQSVSANCATPFAAWPPSAGYLPRTSGGMLPTLDSTVEPLEPSEPANRCTGPGSTAGAISIAGGASRSMGVSSISRAALGTSLPGCPSVMLSSWGGDPVAAGVSDRSPSYLMSTGMPSIAGLSNVPSGHMGSCDTITFAHLCVASPSAVVAAGPPAPNPHGGGGGAGAAPRIQQGGAVPGISGIAGGGSSYGFGYDRPMHLGVGGSPSYSSYMLKAGGSCSGYSEAALPLCTPDGPVAAKMRSTMAAYSTAGEDEQAAAGAFATTANLSVGRGGAAGAGSSTGFRSYQNHPHVLSSDPMPPSELEAARTAAALGVPAPAPAVVAVRSFRNMSVIVRESSTSTVTPRRMGASYTGMPYAPMTSLPEVDTAIIGAAAGAVVHEASRSSAGFRSGSGAVPSAAVVATASASGIGAGGDEWVLALDTGDQLADPSALTINGPCGSASMGAPRVAPRSTSRSLLLGGSNSSKVQPIPSVVCRSRSRSRFGSTLQAASSGSFAIAAVSVAAAGGGVGFGADGGISPLSGNVCSTADGAPGVGSGAVGATANELLRRQSSLWAVASSSLRSPPSIGEAMGSNSAAVAAIGDMYDNTCTTSPSGVVLLGNRRLTRGEEGEGGSLGVGWSSGGGASLGGDGGSGRSSKNSALSKLLRVMKKALSFK